MMKRNWKTVELDETDMADFAAMGGLEIDVLSDDSSTLKALGVSTVSGKKSEPTKKKKKSSKTAVSVDISTPKKESESVSVDVSRWESYGLDSRVVEGLRNMKFEIPTPIQDAVIVKAMTGIDILGAAQTGSGKTLAFGLPIVHSILSTNSPLTIKALCVLPTRELAVQVCDHLAALSCGVTIGTVIGGMSVDKQMRILSHNPDIVVGTPGRIAGLLGITKKREKDTQESQTPVCEQFKKNLCTHLKYLVLDEADRLLEQAHFRDLTSILAFIYASTISTNLQSFVFSATLPVEGHDFARLLNKLKLQSPEKRFVCDLSATNIVPKTLSFKSMFPKSDLDREAFLIYYLFMKHNTTSQRSIVFVNAISYVYRLASVLPLCFPNLQICGIHSGLKQKDRLKKLDQFKAANGAILIATDLAARGLDLPRVDSVIHLQPPRTPESLIHRSGRTARAGNSGECVLIITPEQTPNWKKAIRMGLNLEIEQIEKLPAISGDIAQVREIQKLASKIEAQSHKQKRDAKDKAWTSKMCLEADLWDSDEDVSDENDEEIPTNRNGTQKVTQEDYFLLEDMLKEPLPSKVQR